MKIKPLQKLLTKTTKEKPLQSNNRVSLPIEAPFRFFCLVFVLFFIFSVSMIIITVRDSLVDKILLILA